ncbi:unnamed protein product [Rotaria sp. Silwood1]|nr:unnamed protein product [Rotaria sp. Silwood1]CAF1076627.1 unnamed protein product [Rotaria sp. Silwood1]CAF3413268.1 unnamed protein product [Rotaria sp. Silwood1]CAF3438262.1 unnamed protein product [Rotaria sp. Silwood1]CAF4787951.1 unnamed protein product [Rotaria sp. Silwood1]
MDESSTTITLSRRSRKRSISSHRHSKTDNDGRTSLIKTKIQKIDGQYRASPTCPINNEEEQTQSSDDQDEPLIVATVPPLIQDSSNYRTRQDIYDDETGDDQQSNSSSTDYSPIHQSESSISVQLPIKSTIITIQKPTQLFNENPNETINETSLNIPTMSTKRSTCLINEENIQEKSVTIEQSVHERTKTIKKSNLNNKMSLSNSSSAIPIDQNQINNSTIQTSSSSPLSTIDEATLTTEDTTNKPSASLDVNLSNNKQSQNTNDQSKVKVRLKTIPPSPQIKKDNKPITNVKTNKSVEQKSIKKPTSTQKETVITTKKSTPTITPKKPIKTSKNIIPSSNNNNSEKQLVRPSSIPSLSKLTEKKSSDISNTTTTTTTKSSTESLSIKPSPVILGKIPKLNPAIKPKSTDKLTSLKSLTDQKSDIPSSGNTLSNNKGSNILEKNLSNIQRFSPKRRSPQRPNRSQQNPINNSDPLISLSPRGVDDNIDIILGKQPSISNQRYSSLHDNDTRTTTNFSRISSIGLENTQSQSPLSPDPSSTLYPPPSPPTLPPPSLPSRSIPSTTKALIDSRTNQPHVLSSTNELSQTHNRKNFSTPPGVPISRPNSSSNLISTQSISSVPSMSNDFQDPWTTNKSNNLWDSASSDEELEDDSNARRFFHQNMRAVDEELSKIDEPHTTTSPLLTDSRTEQLLKRQKKASLGLTSNDGTYERNIIEPSASVDDFECVAMDLDSPKHRTQSESSDQNQTIVEPSNSKNTNNGAG